MFLIVFFYCTYLLIDFLFINSIYSMHWFLCSHPRGCVSKLWQYLTRLGISCELVREVSSRHPLLSSPPLLLPFRFLKLPRSSELIISEVIFLKRWRLVEILMEALPPRPSRNTHLRYVVRFQLFSINGLFHCRLLQLELILWFVNFWDHSKPPWMLRWDQTTIPRRPD